ncbi:MAG: V-type ATPase subunit [Anaerovoracaceae bacterium]|jgi:V/A-type H+-transporting ATPase subunit C
MGYKDTDYLHAAARVTYLENRLTTREDLVKVIGAADMGEVSRILSGKALFKDHEIQKYEEAFAADLAETYELVEDITGEMGITEVFRYPIDGHNMKVYVKARVAPGDFSPLYKQGGVVPAVILRKEIDEKNFGIVPKALGEAALEAIDALAKTGDSQIVDIIIDKAVIYAIGEKAMEINSPILSRYVEAKIDLTNLKTALRLLRMKKDTYAAAAIFAAGGQLSVEGLRKAYGMGFDGIAELAKKMPQADHIVEVIGKIKEGGPIGLLEEGEDRYMGAIFEQTKIIPFGIEPVIAYLYKKEREIRALRLVIVSRMFDLPEEDTLERLRLIYGN